jgi:hypothetical protein
LETIHLRLNGEPRALQAPPGARLPLTAERIVAAMEP